MAAVAAMTRRDRTLEASLPQQHADGAPNGTLGEPASDSDDEAILSSLTAVCVLHVGGRREFAFAEAKAPLSLWHPLCVWRWLPF